MSFELIVSLAIGCLVASVILVILLRKFLFRKKTKPSTITSKWREVEVMVKDKSKWNEAIIMADEVLSLACQKCGSAGKKTGENMVDLQAKFSDNESLWFAHKLSKKVREESDIKLKPEQAKKAILSFKRALKDLGELS
ncbi:hypothetical protein A3F37_04445 [Candidatus Saccharibacteria bacterium RIFCSPHIGHO2_12_FULL_41_12]|nr:MAG: hypothetical protein A3F37_04445 [Candidatus Saccharibacteria bacterium RIFCSPHIGHO2_12_FULL_41_12]